MAAADALASFTARQNSAQVIASTTPPAAQTPPKRAGMRRSPLQVAGRSSKASAIRHHTSGMASSVMSRPISGVKPNSSTHK